ncbi:MarR family winged helix-turn-helix transcriptional regulator [Microbacterium sp. SA39]|uniref:MarR family winged helix-turn-helix transcriptional regulator n=1 Tax=Microbacterium sp. SA39 TaxID=1263625 RepID=UPI0005FA21A4|nr:hypothetical protein [Microbacterium sp. SA39]KJQ55467.1 hypothetical protein RS85_00746 [Microbacterium sp. SA39]
MNTDTHDPENTSRPFGYWLKAADRLMAAEFDTAFQAEQASRRDWRILNVIDGTVPRHRPLNDHKLHRLVERGWVVADGESGWTLTDEGRAAKDRLGTRVDGIRAKVADAVSAEEMATTLASLEKIARAFGWDEETPLPRGRRHGFGERGHGRGFPGRFGRRFGHGFSPAFGHGFGPDAEQRDDECRHGEHGQGRHGHRGFRDGHGPGHGDQGHHPGHGPQRAVRFAQHAYERGFDAGFSRGRDA